MTQPTSTAPPPPQEQPRLARRRHPPNWGLRLALAFLIVAGLVVAAGVRYYSWCEDASGPQRRITFTVAEGASGGQIVDALHEHGVLRCGLVSKWLLRRSGKADAIRAGTYTLTTNMTPDDAFTALTKAPPAAPTVDLTIPEGYRLTQIAERVQQVLHVPAQRFETNAGSGTWSLPPYLPKGKPLEGFLFPDTYRFLKKGTTPKAVIHTMLRNFRKRVSDLPWSNAQKLGVTPYQVVTIASMIEKEARVEQDRPLIAAVIYNRLAKDMPLGIDATVAYIDPDPSNGLTASDFLIDSPYNTRLHTGLPPTPIASPGLPSLQAALNPAQVDYLYYVLC
ncbi:MAG TPA: endolytic transglycosylase MltG, partial [Actinomycetota bacterium]|nr:endolytic transglycosylase MltG [Actinomycetota bacterium]